MSDNEIRYFDALKRIASYTPPEIEMAYENVIQEAKIAVRGKRRPKP